MSAVKSHYLNYGFPPLPNHHSPYPSPDIDKIFIQCECTQTQDNAYERSLRKRKGFQVPVFSFLSLSQ